jgi:hypothetical protein
MIYFFGLLFFFAAQIIPRWCLIFQGTKVRKYQRSGQGVKVAGFGAWPQESKRWFLGIGFIGFFPLMNG